MPDLTPHRRRKSSTHIPHGDIPSFLENSPFFLPISDEADLPKPVPPPTLKQLVKSKTVRKGARDILLFIIFVTASWYFWPRQGDQSYAALGSYGLIHGGGAQCLYDSKAVAVIPNPTSRSGEEYKDVDWEKNAYVTYVTKGDVLCNAVMIFESLKRLGSKAKRVMIIPDTEEFKTEDYSSRSGVKDEMVKRLLKEAVENYGVKLERVRVIRKLIAYGNFRFQIIQAETNTDKFYRRVARFLHQAHCFQSHAIRSCHCARFGCFGAAKYG